MFFKIVILYKISELFEKKFLEAKLKRNWNKAVLNRIESWGWFFLSALLVMVIQCEKLAQILIEHVVEVTLQRKSIAKRETISEPRLF